MQKGYPIAGSVFDENAELCLHCEHSTQCAYTNTEQNPATRAFACAVTLAIVAQYNLEWKDGELTWEEHEPRRKAMQSLSHRALQLAYTAARAEKHTPKTQRLVLDCAQELQKVYSPAETKELNAQEKTRIENLFGKLAMWADFGGNAT